MAATSNAPTRRVELAVPRRGPTDLLQNPVARPLNQRTQRPGARPAEKKRGYMYKKQAFVMPITNFLHIPSTLPSLQNRVRGGFRRRGRFLKCFGRKAWFFL